MSVAVSYQAALDRGDIDPDPAQRSVVDAFDALLVALQAPRPEPKKRLFRPVERPPPTAGLYVWGGVGRGKTWLMDLFFNTLPGQAKVRLHFHRFMHEVHRAMQERKGQSDPLSLVARDWATRYRLLCLDEFSVSDIGDAMILAGLLRALFAEGVTLVTTSNVPPDGLYPNGLQRASFLPAIELIKTHTEVMELGGEQDYRRQILEDAAVYHTPLAADTDRHLLREFERLANEPYESDGVVEVMGRDIPFRHRVGGLAWFDFEVLCGPPRSQNDYLELARCHHTLIVSDIPVLGAALDDVARRFVLCIDELYDRQVKLIVSAASPPDALYQGDRLAFEFQRTASRLTEMQTHAYLHKPHRG